jgi:lysophospholipid acyltransferase (LPLAT)-like uncharacterized protein
MNDTPKKPMVPTPRHTPRWVKRFGKSLSGKWLAWPVSWMATLYLELVYWTNSFLVEPDNALDVAKPEQPVILAVWHGQHILLPALRIKMPASVMISRSLGGEITARVAEIYGSKAIRASGGRSRIMSLKKGGMRGFMDMLAALENGENVVQTADVPKGVSRQAYSGIIRLAAKSGRPIIPLAVASSRRYTFKNAWDKAALNLPFGKTAICMGELLSVSDNKKSQEAAREELELQLNKLTTRAYQLVGCDNE